MKKQSIERMSCLRPPNVNSHPAHLNGETDTKRSARLFRKTARHTGMQCGVGGRLLLDMFTNVHVHSYHLAMTAAQTRIAETLETFYGAADRTSEGAMAGHAYKRSVDDLDGGFGRELV